MQKIRIRPRPDTGRECESCLDLPAHARRRNWWEGEMGMP